jgi:ligand-binding sensor domain-containing protein
VVDTATSTVVASLTEKMPPTTSLESSTAGKEDSAGFIFHIRDFVLVEPKLYALFDGGIAIYDFEKKSHEIIRSDESLNALEAHEGKIYAGGEQLYTLENAILTPVEYEVPNLITELYSYGYRLMVGTENGLYAKSIFGPETYADDLPITAMVADNDGLWVGTKGQGLFRWNGEELQKRYLVRDTSLFDTVNTLAYNHDHVYVGTVNGLHVYNGGSWKNLSTADGLPSNNVTTIDASQWVVYAGTDNGVFSYFSDEVTPIDKLENRAVNSIRVRGRQLVAATDYDGILLKSHRTVKTLVQPVADSSVNILSLLP